MADGQTKQNSKEAIAVNKAIPKVVNALEAIISRTKGEEFRERCLQKLLIKETTDLASRLESKLWEIAEQKLGVKQISNEDDRDDQVVPGEKACSQTSSVETNNSHQIPSLEKDPFDDLALIDMPFPPTDANGESFYEDENINDSHVSAQKSPFLPATYSLSSKQFTQDKLVGKVPSMDTLERSLLENKDGEATTDDWLNNFTEDSFWMDNNQDYSSLVNSQNLTLKRQRSPVSLSTRKIVATRSEPNLHAYNFVHSKEQERDSTEVVIISDEEEEHYERKLETKTHYHRQSTSSPTKSDDSEIRLGSKADNPEDPLHQNVSEQLSFTCNDVQIETRRIKDNIIVDGKVPGVQESNRSLVTQSPQLEIIEITDHSLIQDFDALEDNFDD